MANEWNTASKAIGLVPGYGTAISAAMGLGSSIYDALFGGTKRAIDPKVQKLLNQKEGMADKLKSQSENQEAVAQQQKTDVRQNMEGALLSSGGKAANTYNSDSSIPMQAIMSAVRSQAPIAGAITQGITGATSEAEGRKAQLSGEAGQMYGQVAQATEELTREYPKTSAWDTIMKGMGATGLYSQMLSDGKKPTTNENNQPLTRPITEGNPDMPNESNDINPNVPQGNEFIDELKKESFFMPSGPRNISTSSALNNMPNTTNDLDRTGLLAEQSDSWDGTNPEELNKGMLRNYLFDKTNYLNVLRGQGNYNPIMR